MGLSGSSVGRAVSGLVRFIGHRTGHTVSGIVRFIRRTGCQWDCPVHPKDGL